MVPILTAAQMREADRRAIDELSIPSLVLMENAARGACDLLGALLGSLEGMRLAILCGKGNNGGDGIALARHAAIQGADVTCILLAPPDSLSNDAAAQYRIARAFMADRLMPWESVRESDNEYDAIIDAILGTGATGDVRGVFAEAIRWGNEREGLKLALDIPTGIDSDSGEAEGGAFLADATATMAALKPGLLLGRGAESSGDLYVIGIGAPGVLYEGSGLELLDRERALAGMPDVARERNKYDRGNVLIVAGSRGMTGAAVMAAEGAMRAGAGLTVMAIPEAAANMPQQVPPEIMTMLLPSEEHGAFSAGALDSIVERSDSYAAIALGPGLSRSEDAAAAARSLVLGSNAPLVLDADGLNAFAEAPDELHAHESPLVITPHHGEMARLLGVERSEIARNPLPHARSAAARFDCIAVLKGAPTIVALPDGRAWINSAGNPGMATGGTGDVLTGMIASLIAQTGEPVDGTLTAVYLHSLAADRASEETGIHSLAATDIIAHIPDAYQSILSPDSDE